MLIKWAMFAKRILKNERGFTLIELMVVAVVIGILVSVAMPVFISASSNAKLNTCKGNLRLIDGAIQTYGAENQANPTNLDDLVPQYLKEIPSEPYGGSYSLIPVSSAAASHGECTEGHTY